MPILCSGGESASNIQKADSTESNLVFGSRCCGGRVLSRFHGCMPVCQRSSPRRRPAVVEKKDQMRTRPLDTGTGQVGMTEVSKVGYRFRHPRPGCSRELVAKACLIAAVIYVCRRRLILSPCRVSTKLPSHRVLDGHAALSPSTPVSSVPEVRVTPFFPSHRTARLEWILVRLVLPSPSSCRRCRFQGRCHRDPSGSLSLTWTITLYITDTLSRVINVENGSVCGCMLAARGECYQQWVTISPVPTVMARGADGCWQYPSGSFLEAF